MAKKRSRRRQKVRSRSHSPQPTHPTDTDTAETISNSSTMPTVSTQQQQQQFIGQDILDWHDETESSSSTFGSNNNNLVSASKVDETSIAVNTSDAATDTNQNPNTWKCRRAVGMDTRFLATPQGQGSLTADSVVQEYATFVQTTVTRGVAPCWLASTVEKKQQQTQPAKAVVPGKEKHHKKTSSTSTIRVQLTALGNDNAKQQTTGGRALFSLSKVQVQASPASKSKNDKEKTKGDGANTHGDVQASNAKENKTDKEKDKGDGAVHIPKELLATNSWKVLGTLGACARA